jgi:hypothetical protein
VHVEGCSEHISQEKTQNKTGQVALASLGNAGFLQQQGL